MSRPSHNSILGVAGAGLLLALLLLPGIAGLIEGDFDYPRLCFNRGWSDKSSTTKAQAISEIYAWSFWRIGLNAEEPELHVIQRYIKRIRTLEKIQSAASGKTRA